MTSAGLLPPSVAAYLDLAGDDSELLGQARDRWPQWVRTHPALADVPGGLPGLSGWLLEAHPAEADRVLLALVEQAAPDGGDDRAAAGVVAWALLPAAGAMAARLRPFTPAINEIVAGELWIQVRTFPWRRLRKVAANIIMNTRCRVLRECGVASQVRRVDPTWAATTAVDPTTTTVWERRPAPLVGHVAAGHLPGHLVGPGEPAARRSAAEELLDVLDWARDRQVISRDDQVLLLGLVAAADRTATVALGRGWGGLMANDVAEDVAGQLGVSPATVRRRARRSLQALRIARPVDALCA